LAAVLFVGACATIRTGHHRDEANDFSRYQSFSWIADSPYVRGDSSTAATVDPLTQTKIQRAIRETLEGRGYRFTDDRNDADFVIAYTVGSRQDVSVDSYPIAFRGAWGWHVRGGFIYAYDRDVHTYTRGTLGVDIFDEKTRQPVWHGWAEKTVTESDKADPTATIYAAVGKLFEGFPN